MYTNDWKENYVEKPTSLKEYKYAIIKLTSTRNTCMQQPLAMSSKANDLLS